MSTDDGNSDIVDTEPSTGDVYKMLAGSVHVDMDSMDDANTDKPVNVENSRLIPNRFLSTRSKSPHDTELLQRRRSRDSQSHQGSFTLSPEPIKIKLSRPG